MNDMAVIGEMIGKAIAANKAQQPSVNVHVPAVEVSVDPGPIAQAMRDGAEASAKSVSDIAELLAKGLAEAIVTSAELSKVADLSGVEGKADAIAKAIGAVDMSSLSAAIMSVSQSIDGGAAALREVSRLMAEQNKIMSAGKRISYDAQGRIISIEVA